MSGGRSLLEGRRRQRQRVVSGKAGRQAISSTPLTVIRGLSLLVAVAASMVLLAAAHTRVEE